MTDIVSAPARSRMMSGIRSRDTQPEIKLRRALHTAGLRYRLHVSDMPGRPDIVLPKYSAVILVHGCFWHRHRECRLAYTPKTRLEFWRAKFAANEARDARTVGRLKASGWRVLIVWECKLRSGGHVNAAREAIRWINSSSQTAELPPRRGPRVETDAGPARLICSAQAVSH